MQSLEKVLPTADDKKQMRLFQKVPFCNNPGQQVFSFILDMNLQVVYKTLFKEGALTLPVDKDCFHL
jgi:hypothetical protein